MITNPHIVANTIIVLLECWSLGIISVWNSRATWW